LATVRDGSAEIAGGSPTVFPRYLNTTESRLERVASDAGRQYRLVATGHPRRLDHEPAGYRAVAVVAPDNFVETLSVEYDHPRTGTTVRVHLRCDRGQVAVATPDW
jgi:hypothetical protein